ncbi:MAG: HemK2/MTQ2 family protein methyltransferase [Candidatus Hadarchaeum sp.]|uniref:HemK2/MTQ2 family protein methyltransferase n=1 Tax=Candidatus Hadarchaeum sp. TaxID=2883567 RepID=UPI003D0C3C71
MNNCTGQGTKIVFYQDSKFIVYPSVYEPAEDTFLIADNLDATAGERVLELGTGCGILAILAAKAGANVVATDVNPVALECARANACQNAVDDRIDFRLGDLFDPVGNERFDVIIFNPPYLPVEPREKLNEPLELAWDGGRDGRRVINHFLSGLPTHLRPRGRAFFVQSSLSNLAKTFQFLEANGFEFKTLKKRLFFEEIFLFLCLKR